MNGRKARESGLRRKASIAPGVAVPSRAIVYDGVSSTAVMFGASDVSETTSERWHAGARDCLQAPRLGKCSERCRFVRVQRWDHSPGNGPHFTFVGERRAPRRGARLPTRKPGLASVEPAAANTERNVLRNVALQAPSLTGELGLK
jgi:hypothetical protein